MEDQRWDEGGPKLRDALVWAQSQSMDRVSVTCLGLQSLARIVLDVEEERMARWWRNKKQVLLSHASAHALAARERGEKFANKGSMGMQWRLWRTVAKQQRELRLEPVEIECRTGPGPGKGLCVDPVVDGRSDWTIWKNQSPMGFIC